jgi:hypothetical protein
MILVPIEFDDGEKGALPIHATFDDSSGKDTLPIFIETKFGQLSGVYDPEKMAETIWEYFKKSFPTDEPFPKNARRLRDDREPRRHHSTARTLFEYAYDILADHILEILEDSLKLACHEVLVRALTDGEYLTHTLPESTAKEIRARAVDTALNQVKRRVHTPASGPNPILERRRFIYECNQALKKMMNENVPLTQAELAHCLNLDISSLKKRFREIGFGWKEYKARFKKEEELKS